MATAALKQRPAPALKHRPAPALKTFHATMLVTRAEEWCVEAETAEEARELLAAGQGHRCHIGERLQFEVEGVEDSFQSSCGQIISSTLNRTSSNASNAPAAAKLNSDARPSTKRSGNCCSTSGATRMARPPPMTAAYQGISRQAANRATTRLVIATAIVP